MSAPGWRAAALGLLLDRRCQGCGAPDGLVCPACGALLRGPPAAVAPRLPGMPPCWATARYDGPLRPLLAAAKEQGQLAVRRQVGQGLGLAAGAALRSAASAGSAARVVLVPVPSSAAAVRARGDDVVLALARDAARLLRAAGDDVTALAALRTCGARRDQVGLTTAERQANVAATMRVRRRRLGAVRAADLVVVVDDVVTSGATLAEAAAVLRSAGARVPVAAVVAATPRRFPVVRGRRHDTGDAAVPGAP